jgi:RNA polymerase sigma-70 factor, ECF subfamily
VTLQQQIESIYREEYGRVVASLARRFGDLDIAEDAASEALIAALEKWPTDGIPPNPGGWLTTTAGNRAIDKIRREKLRHAKHEAADMIRDDTPHEPTGHRRRRPAQAHLHLLPPSAGPGGAGRADAAASGRPDGS